MAVVAVEDYLAMTDVYVSQREFARQVGKYSEWVRRKITQGILTPDENGQLPLVASLQAIENLKKDPSEMEQDVAQNVAPNLPHVAQNVAVKEKISIAEEFALARMKEKRALAKLRELELRYKSGELIERSIVEEDADKTAAFLREQFLTLPARVSGSLEGKSQREIEAILEDAISEAISGINRSSFMRGEAKKADPLEKKTK